MLWDDVIMLPALLIAEGNLPRSKAWIHDEPLAAQNAQARTVAGALVNGHPVLALQESDTAGGFIQLIFSASLQVCSA